MGRDNFYNRCTDTHILISVSPSEGICHVIKHNKLFNDQYSKDVRPSCFWWIKLIHAPTYSYILHSSHIDHWALTTWVRIATGSERHWAEMYSPFRLSGRKLSNNTYDFTTVRYIPSKRRMPVPITYRCGDNISSILHGTYFSSIRASFLSKKFCTHSKYVSIPD